MRSRGPNGPQEAAPTAHAKVRAGRFPRRNGKEEERKRNVKKGGKRAAQGREGNKNEEMRRKERVIEHARAGA
jgi:hypothetical protein